MRRLGGQPLDGPESPGEQVNAVGPDPDATQDEHCTSRAPDQNSCDDCRSTDDHERRTGCTTAEAPARQEVAIYRMRKGHGRAMGGEVKRRGSLDTGLEVLGLGMRDAWAKGSDNKKKFHLAHCDSHESEGGVVVWLAA